MNVKELQTLMQLLFCSGAAGRPVLLLQDLCLHRPERRLCAGQTQRCVSVQAGIPRGHFESITEAQFLLTRSVSLVTILSMCQESSTVSDNCNCIANRNLHSLVFSIQLIGNISTLLNN